MLQISFNFHDQSLINPCLCAQFTQSIPRFRQARPFGVRRIGRRPALTKPRVELAMLFRREQRRCMERDKTSTQLEQARVGEARSNLLTPPPVRALELSQQGFVSVAVEPAEDLLFNWGQWGCWILWEARGQRLAHAASEIRRLRDDLCTLDVQGARVGYGEKRGRLVDGERADDLRRCVHLGKDCGIGGGQQIDRVGSVKVEEHGLIGVTG